MFECWIFRVYHNIEVFSNWNTWRLAVNINNIVQLIYKMMNKLWGKKE